MSDDDSIWSGDSTLVSETIYRIGWLTSPVLSSTLSLSSSGAASPTPQSWSERGVKAPSVINAAWRTSSGSSTRSASANSWAWGESTRASGASPNSPFHGCRDTIRRYSERRCKLFTAEGSRLPWASPTGTYWPAAIPAAMPCSRSPNAWNPENPSSSRTVLVAEPVPYPAATNRRD